MKDIILLAETQGTADYVICQLNEVFHPYASLCAVIAGSYLPSHSLSTSLVVIVSKVLETEMQQYVSPGTPVLIADRMMDPCQVSRLYDIPAGSDVLVVNTSPRVTEETIEQLIACGVSGLRYHPYYPGIDSYKKDCRWAVTFGESHLIPPGNYKQTLSLPSRPLGISTFVRVADELGIYDDLRETISSLFMNPLISMTRDLAVTGARNKQISDHLQQIINLFQDGVVVLSEEGNITFQNDIAQRILAIRDGQSPALDQLRQKRTLSGHFFLKLNGSSYYVEPIRSQLHRETSTILLLRDVEKIEHIENSYRRSLADKGMTAQYSFGHIIYHSEHMKALVETAEKFALGDSTVFIHGPSGCGKEMLAQAIHNASSRRPQPFVAVNFASISASLSESELFGYEEGAFTGAKRGGKLGLFQLAHCGTIFLDEIGDAPLELQKKLLRVIQERKILPVGGTKFIPVDVRIIAASNQDMDALMAARQFRQDLYYRLNVLPLYMPPLRERREDILPLFLYFLQSDFGVPAAALDAEVKTLLENHPWKGNVRELRNAAEYASNFTSWDPDWQKRLCAILSPPQPPAFSISSDNNRLAVCGISPQDAASSPADNDNSHSIPGDVPTDQTDSEKKRSALRPISSDCRIGLIPEEQAALLSRLEDHGDLRCFLRLLSILDQPPYCWPRRVIAEKLDQSAAPGELVPSDSQLKRDLLFLKNLGLTNAVTGKGTYIKEAGREVLCLLKYKTDYSI